MVEEPTIKKPIWKKWWFWGAIIVLLIAIGASGGDEAGKVAQDPVGQVSGEVGKEEPVEEPIEEPVEEPAEEPEAPPEEINTETLSQRNAVAKAKDYLDYTAFSKSGLIEQLEYEGFSNADATYAVNKITVDWKEQAVLKGEDYLDYTAFSRSGLIEQLQYEGFSYEEATYAVDTIGF